MSTPPISVQLWSIHNDLKRDFEGSLEAIAEMNFDGVEFAGEFGAFEGQPERLKKHLEKLGLRISGAHVPLEQLRGKHLTETLRFYKSLGAPMLILASDERAHNATEIDDFVTEVNEIFQRLYVQGMPFGFHNHSAEFDNYQGASYWDYIAQNTPEDFILQLDAGWATYAEQSSCAYIERYPGRTRTIHIKAKIPKSLNGLLPADKKTIIGQDLEDWPKIIRTCINKGGTHWLIVEQEDYPEGMTPLQSVHASKQGLDKIIKKMTSQQI